MTIFWIGDLGHQGTSSGHNPDDYPGVRAELQDSDLIPEVRALDFMIGPKFPASDGTRLANALVKGVDRHRLYYVIYRSTIWRRDTGFQAQAYNGSDNHNGHVHTSGHVDDDANGRDWPSVLALGGDELMTIHELHALLLSVLTADTSVERQVRDMIMGGVQSPAGGRGLLSLVMDAVEAVETSPPAPVDTDALVTALTPAIRAIVREELDKTTLGSV